MDQSRLKDKLPEPKYVCQKCRWDPKPLDKSDEEILESYKNGVCPSCYSSFVSYKDLNPIGPFVLVEPIDPNTKSKAGVIIPATSKAWQKYGIARVLKCSETEVYKSSSTDPATGKIIKRSYSRPDVYEGDIVLFERAAVRRIDHGGVYFFVHYGDMECVIEDYANFRMV